MFTYLNRALCDYLLLLSCFMTDIDKGDEVDSFVDRQRISSIVIKSLVAASDILSGTNQNIMSIYHA